MLIYKTRKDFLQILCWLFSAKHGSHRSLFTCLFCHCFVSVIYAVCVNYVSFFLLRTFRTSSFSLNKQIIAWGFTVQRRCKKFHQKQPHRSLTCLLWSVSIHNQYFLANLLFSFTFPLLLFRLLQQIVITVPYAQEKTYQDIYSSDWCW